MFWESGRNIDFIYGFLKRKHVVEGDNSEQLKDWIKRFDNDRKESALSFWYEIHKGINESLREF